jgi:uncharacterized protein (DUF362 family)
VRLLEAPVGAAERRGGRLHVVVKPNWVQHRNDSSDTWEALITSPRLVEEVVRAIATLTSGRSLISVCDAPHTVAQFSAILERGGLAARLDGVRREWPNLQLEVLDLRRERWLEQDGVIARRDPNPPDPRGYTAVDLAAQSCLYRHPGEGRFYGADYDRRVVNEHHHGSRHEYLLAGTPLDADLFVNLPKLKTHRKTGITCALKNLVGINGDKNWLPHHTAGCPAAGGDERPAFGWRDRVELGIKPWLQTATLVAPALAVPIYRQIRRRKHLIEGPTAKIRNGNWQGNDTCWRMALDLNRALLYANRDGTLRSSGNPKPYFCIVDGIIGGEGNGPTDPDPVPSNMLIAGDNPAEVDAVGARLMDLTIDRLPIIARAFDPHPLPLGRCRLDDLRCTDERIGADIPLCEVAPAVEGGFRPHPAWPEAHAHWKPVARGA